MATKLRGGGGKALVAGSTSKLKDMFMNITKVYFLLTIELVISLKIDTHTLVLYWMFLKYESQTNECP